MYGVDRSRSATGACSAHDANCSASWCVSRSSCTAFSRSAASAARRLKSPRSIEASSSSIAAIRCHCESPSVAASSDTDTRLPGNPDLVKQPDVNTPHLTNPPVRCRHGLGNPTGSALFGSTPVRLTVGLCEPTLIERLGWHSTQSPMSTQPADATSLAQRLPASSNCRVGSPVTMSSRSAPALGN